MCTFEVYHRFFISGENILLTLNFVDIEKLDRTLDHAFSTDIDSKSSSVVFSEKATDGNLPSEDWAANIEICDIINETDEG